MARSRKIIKTGLVSIIVSGTVLVQLLTAAGSADAVIWCRPGHCSLGPTTPMAQSTKGMKVKILGPTTVNAGAQIHLVARGFARGEYATVWLYTGKGFKHSSQLNGGVADGGKLDVYRQTVAGITGAGKQKLCVQGMRTKRVACGVYTVRATPVDSGGGDSGYQPPTIGPGYIPPGSA